MKEFNYKKNLIKILKANYISFILGMMTIIIPVVILSINKITIPPFDKLFKIKNNLSSTNHKTNTITYHVVKEGEDLWSISEKFFGSGYYAFQIASFNKIKEPYTLELNQKIMIPTIQPTVTENGEILPDAASTQRADSTMLIYTVKEGDYLFQIAQNIYGDGNFMNKIIIANNIPYPYNIEVGQKLLIPR